MKTLKYSIIIKRSPDAVFDCLTDKTFYPEWAKALGPGMTFEGEWKEGSHISFYDESQGGTKVTVEELSLNEFIKTKHIAMVNTENMEVPLTDDMMKKWIGSREDYFLHQRGDNKTELEVVMLADAAFEKMMDAWPKALEYFKEGCEAR